MEDQEIDKRIERRIAIIGAGAAGLTVAETLREKGYEHITLFEKSDHVGGKCFTTEIEGHLYELGAGIVAESDNAVLRLVKKFDVPIRRVEFGKSILVDSKTGKVFSKKTFLERFALLKQLLFTYRKSLNQYQDITKPGLSNMHSDLSLPFSVFVEKHGIALLAKELEVLFTGFGYGYFDEVPAAYVLKYFNWDTIKAFVKRKVYFFPNGIQHLWTSVAENHDIQYNTTIQRIEREDGVTVTTDKGRLKFDTLIITSPLDEALGFLDGSKQEKELFSKILYVDYRTIACSIKGLEKVGGFIPGNFSPSRKGFPVFWNYRHINSNIYTFYVMADQSMSDDEIVRNIGSLVEKMGGTLERVHVAMHWKYFPHADSEFIKDGHFDTLEAMQGDHHTYYAGEFMNFSTVGLTCEYAEELVKRFF